MQLSLNLLGLTSNGGDFGDVLRAAQLADVKGFDQVSFGEHLALIPAGFHKYPGPRFVRPREFPYYEPLVALAAIASATTRVRLSTNILVTPLRPPLLLAKQIASLDAVSRGRTELAWGVGWHEEEFDANGSSFADRLAVLEEQVAYCRAVWSGSPASYRGVRFSFDDLYSMPLPPQGAAVPIWFGMNSTPRNIERIVRLADGWAPLPAPPSTIREGARQIREKLAQAGRHPSRFPVRATLMPIYTDDGSIDRTRTLATLPDYQEAGVTMVIVDVQQYIQATSELDQLIEDLLAARRLL